MEKRKRYIAILTLLVAALAIDGYYLINKHLTQKSITAVKALEDTVTTKTPIPITPIRLIIPSISVDTTVEHVGRDTKGNMDVPKNAGNVAWYSLGARPGELGNSVIAGHYDTNLGLPAVFYNLKKMKVGDEVIVLGEGDTKYTFVVKAIERVNVNNPPLAKIFGPSNKPNLNLITCEGVWNKKTRSYEQRLVIFTELKTPTN